MTRALVRLLSRNIFNVSALNLRNAVPSQHNPTTVDEEQIARNVQALKNRLKPKVPGGAGGKKGRRGVGGAGSGLESVPGSEYGPFNRISGCDGD